VLQTHIITWARKRGYALEFYLLAEMQLFSTETFEASDDGSHRDGPGSIPGSGQVGFVVDKVALGRVSSASLHSTKFSIITITRGRLQ
jgi:hypothetical protein